MRGQPPSKADCTDEQLNFQKPKIWYQLTENGKFKTLDIQMSKNNEKHRFPLNLMNN